MALHPGEFLLDRILVPAGVPVRRAADQLGLSTEALAMVISGKNPVTIPVAHALSREFGYSRQWWLDLQRAWDDEQHIVAQ